MSIPNTQVKTWKLLHSGGLKEVFFRPKKYDVIHTNYPNPFNISTKIVYEILAYHKVKLAIYDILGREVKVLVNKE